MKHSRVTIALCLSVVFSLALSLSLQTKARAGAGKTPQVAQAPQVVFTNPAAITIPSQGIASPYPSAIVVSGVPTSLPATPGSLKITINGYSHTFPDDVGMVLVGPTGAAISLSDGAGDGSDMVSVTYTLSDTGASQLPDTGAWGPGTYKPANYYTPLDSYPAPGPLTAYNNPGPAGGGAATLTSTFGGTNPNGTWNLFIADFVGGEMGSISGGWSIEIAGGSTAQKPPLDFDGDNKTDYAAVRNNFGSLYWYIQASTSGFSTQQWGSSGDILVPADYDGDNKTDLAVWRAGTFYVLRSTNATLQAIAFGAAGDNPRKTQDFDGDSKADPTVVRNVSGNLVWYTQGSTAGFSAFQFGLAASDVPIRGDFDGDGKADIAVYRNNGGSPANTFFVRRSSDSGLQNFAFGNSTTDYIIPADFDGDGKTDYAVWRGLAGGNGVWYWTRSSDNGFATFSFGVAGTDVPTPGDYDGDGKTDQAVWRAGSGGTFFVNGSTGGFSATGFGATGDEIPAFTFLTW